MESREKLEPHKITKPIQLLAAWLLGLIAVNGAFLFFALQINEPKWISGALVVASIVNVPLFLLSIFILQTKFRPEMQEDTFYSKYLEKKTGNTVREVTAESVAALRHDIATLEKVVSERVLDGIKESELEKIRWSKVTIMLNKRLPNFSAITKELKAHGIPLHELFGGAAGTPDNLNVAVGRGFDVDQIRAIVDTLLNVTDGWICYAHDDDAIDQYDNQVLIGAYGSNYHGVELRKFKAIVDSKDITLEEMYKMFGK